MYGEVSNLVNIKLCQKSNCPIHSSYKYSKFALVLCQDLKNKIGQFLISCFWCLNQLNWNKQMVNDSTWKSLFGVLCPHYTTFPSSCVVVIIMPNFQERKLSFLNTNELFTRLLIWEVAEQWHKFISHNSAAWVLYIMAPAFQRETRLLWRYK